MSDKPMTQEQFDLIVRRLDAIDAEMMRKADIYPAVFTVFALFIATVVGSVVVLNSLGLLAG